MIAKIMLLSHLTIGAFASTCGVTAGMSHVQIELLDGARVSLTVKDRLYLTISAHHRKLLVIRVNPVASTILVDVPNSETCRDMRATIRSASFRTSVSSTFDGSPEQIDVPVMLLPRRAKTDFAKADWDNLKLIDPLAYSFFGRGRSEKEAKENYQELIENHPLELAAFFNLSTGLIEYDLDGDNLFDYFKEPVEEKPFRQDRFFAYVSPKLLDVVLQERLKRKFATEHLPWRWLHPGASASYKQTAFKRADVQISFHQNWRKQIDGVDCIVAEVDIDYYPPGFLHIKEVVLNKLFWRLTNPTKVFALRKYEQQKRGEKGFSVPYDLRAKK
jgi:hypothetical protein